MRQLQEQLWYKIMPQLFNKSAHLEMFMSGGSIKLTPRKRRSPVKSGNSPYICGNCKCKILLFKRKHQIIMRKISAILKKRRSAQYAISSFVSSGYLSPQLSSSYVNVPEEKPVPVVPVSQEASCLSESY